MWKFVILTCFVATVGENTQCKEMLRRRIRFFKPQGHELAPTAMNRRACPLPLSNFSLRAAGFPTKRAEPRDRDGLLIGRNGRISARLRFCRPYSPASMRERGSR